MTGVRPITLAIEYIAKDFYCFYITQADIIQTPYRLTRERGFSDYHTKNNGLLRDLRVYYGYIMSCKSIFCNRTMPNRFTQMCARFCTSLCEMESCRHFPPKVWALFGPPTFGRLWFGLGFGFWAVLTLTITVTLSISTNLR